MTHMTAQMPPFDQRVGDAPMLATELDRIINQIRLTSDRIAGESWEQFYERTYHLGQAELARRERQRARHHPTPNPAKGGDFKE
jgi:hypothetical protein